MSTLIQLRFQRRRRRKGQQKKKVSKSEFHNVSSLSRSLEMEGVSSVTYPSLYNKNAWSSHEKKARCLHVINFSKKKIIYLSYKVLKIKRIPSGRLSVPKRKKSRFFFFFFVHVVYCVSCCYVY